MNFIKKLTEDWSNRTKGKKYSDMPSWILVILGTGSAIVASHSGWIIAKATPMYYEAALKTADIDPKGALVGLLLIVIFLIFVSFGTLANTCRKIITERHFT